MEKNFDERSVTKINVWQKFITKFVEKKFLPFLGDKNSEIKYITTKKIDKIISINVVIVAPYT